MENSTTSLSREQMIHPEEEKQYWKACTIEALGGLLTFTTHSDFVGSQDDIHDKRDVVDQLASLTTELADAMVKEFQKKYGERTDIPKE